MSEFFERNVKSSSWAGRDCDKKNCDNFLILGTHGKNTSLLEAIRLVFAISNLCRCFKWPNTVFISNVTSVFIKCAFLDCNVCLVLFFGKKSCLLIRCMEALAFLCEANCKW